MSTILWFRQDLRLADQPALIAAVAEGEVVPVYILDDEAPGDWAIGAAQRWWLHHSLDALTASLEALGSRLILRHGKCVPILEALMEETGSTAIHALRHYEPWWRKAEAALDERICLHDGNQLVPIESVRTGSGKPFRIYGAFWKGIQPQLPPDAPEPAPKSIPAPKNWPACEALKDWALLPTKPDWSSGFDGWMPGEAGGQERLTEVEAKVAAYEDKRNLPAVEGTTRLSPHLHHGEVSPRSVWHAAAGGADAEKLNREIAWRDFTAGVVLAMPDYADTNGREKFDRLPWRKGQEADADLEAWRRGRTGYPIVDAGMRQMWVTGWMHNRVRMITASFLVKHLLIDWRIGEKWFWDCLIDADYGNNAVNWQWVAGTGIDSNMFSRIMAPLSQSEKFDAGDYIRNWVPELADVPDSAIHDPDEHEARPDGYPAKIIGHREARERALAAMLAT